MSQTAQKPNAPNPNTPSCPLCESPNTTRLSDQLIHKIGGDEFACWECEDTFRIEQLPGGADGGFYPASMVERKQWMNWYYMDIEGTRKKVPGTLKSSVGVVSTWSNEQNWRSFGDSLKYLDKNPSFEGVTYILSEDDPFVAFDGDDVRDPETGEVHPDFKELVSNVGSYTDVSASGTGLHIVVRGQLPDYLNTKAVYLPDHPGFPDAKIEIFSEGQHMVMTGDHLSGTPRRINERQGWIDAFERKYESQSPSDPHDTEDAQSDESDAETVSLPGGYKGGDSPDDRPQCYHAALKAREEHEGRRAFQTNTYAGLLGLYSEYPIKVIIDHFERHEPPYNFDEGKTRYHLERLQDKDLFRPSVYTLAQGGILSEPECDCPLHETEGEDRGTTKDIPEGKKMKPAQAIPLGSNPPTKKDASEAIQAPDFSYATRDRVTDAGRELGIASKDQILNHNRVDRGRTQVSKVLDALSDSGGVYHIRDGRYAYWCFGKGYVNEGRIEEIERQQDREIGFEWSDLKWITEIEEEE